MNFFDTNVLIAASIDTHIHHEDSRKCLAGIRETGGACAAHSMAEAYAVLTRLPSSYRIPKLDAIRIVEDTMTFATLITLTEKETISTLRSLAERDLGGGLAYDALLIACARKIGAELIFTHNQKHFRQIAPDLADRIRIP